MNNLRRGMAYFSFLLSLAGLSLTASNLRADLIVHPGEEAVYKFHFIESPTVQGVPINFLGLLGDIGTNFSASSPIALSLYDGDRLIGGETSSLYGLLWNFSGPPTPFFPVNTVLVDFESIMNGQIEGSLVVHPLFQGTSMNPTQPPYYNVDLRFTTGRYDADVNHLFGPSPEITEAFVRLAVAPVPVPESSSFGLTAGMLLFGVIIYSSLAGRRNYHKLGTPNEAH